VNKLKGNEPFFKAIYCANDITKIAQCFGAAFCDFDPGLKSNIHPWLRVVHVGVSVILMADVIPRKQSCIVTLS